jgi:hypothetical protein
LFCYATFELTSPSLFKHRTWPVAAVDISWGAFVTAVSSTLGLLIADWIGPKVCPRHSGAMRSIEPGISRFRGWRLRTIPE